MTAQPELPPITCPSSLVASCAPLLGFEPTDCVVAFVQGVPGRAGPVLVRTDLGDPAGQPLRAREMASGIVGTGGNQVDLVAFVEVADDRPAAGLPGERMLVELERALGAAGLPVAALGSTNGRVWWSHGCPDADCCGWSEPLDEEVQTRVRAEYAYAGFAPLASRDELAARVAPDPAASAEVADALLRLPASARSERWRDAQIAHLDGLLVPGGRRTAAPRAQRGTRSAPGVPPATAARALRALEDVPVRDVLLLRLIGAEAGPEPWRETIATLCALVRMAPAGTVAPAATLLALASWMRGDGALANAALDRSHADDPGYRLAALGGQVMANGIDPEVWRVAMAGVTEDECRGSRGAEER
jgi:hypothetical protein